MTCSVDLPRPGVGEGGNGRHRQESPHAGQSCDVLAGVCGTDLGGTDFATAFLLCFLQGLDETSDPSLQCHGFRAQQVLLILLILLGGRVIALERALGNRRGLGLVGGDVGGELFS